MDDHFFPLPSGEKADNLAVYYWNTTREVWQGIPELGLTDGWINGLAPNAGRYTLAVLP